jgi:tagatose 6-phosphate kinase
LILTITLNPSVDISYKLPGDFSLDTVNRVEDVSKTAGGKGLNVTRVLHQLEEEVAATGFLGGSLGAFIRKEMSPLAVHDYFVEIDGATRNCIAVIHEGQQTEILESGPTITQAEAGRFLDNLASHVKQADLITISGSLPKGLPANYYNQILKLADQHNTRVLLDTKGELLGHALENKSKPYLIKPNQEELGDLLGKELPNEIHIIEALKSDLFRDIPWVVVTLGAYGAIVKHEQTMYNVTIPKVQAVNPVGSGDAVIAGLAAGISRNLSDENLIKFGLAMGVLNALEERTGHIDPNKVDWCVEQIQVEKLVQ